MEAIPRKYGEWSQFDRYCKLVLYHEAIDYLREMKCRRDREVLLDAVSPAAPLLLDKYARRTMAARHRADGYILSVPSRTACPKPPSTMTPCSSALPRSTTSATRSRCPM